MTNYKLTEHMKKHETPAPFKCKMENCAKTFRSKIGLIQHEASHTGDFKFSCDVCGKGRCHRTVCFSIPPIYYMTDFPVKRIPNQELSHHSQEDSLEHKALRVQHLWTRSESKCISHKHQKSS